MSLFKGNKREYIISYNIYSNSLNRKGAGHTYREEERGKKLNFKGWHQDTVTFWREAWRTSDVEIVVTNIFENK